MNGIRIRRMPILSGLMALLFIASMATAILISYSANESRKLLNQLFVQAQERNKLQAEWGRLVLEHSTWTAPNRIEKLAVENLQLLVPEPGTVRVVTP